MNEQRSRMRTTLVIVALFAPVVSVNAQLRVLPDPQPQQVFSGTARRISLLVSNASDKTATAEVRARLQQASSATTVHVSDTPWKTLQVLAGQATVESVWLDFPAVEAETRFLIQWLAGTNQILGRTEVLVYPNDLLKQLKLLAGDHPLGIFEPESQLKLLLNSVSVEFADLEDTGLESFDGKLAIVVPMGPREQMSEGLPKEIEALAKKGVAVVWIQPRQTRRNKIEPSFYSVPSHGQATIVVQAPLVANLAEKPQSQLNLIQFARFALHPEPVRLPRLTDEP